MPSFAFTAVDLAGARRRGVREAATDDAVAAALRTEGLFVLDLRPAAPRRAAKAGVPRTDLLEVTRTLATLLPAGLPLPRALEAARGMGGGALDALLDEVRSRVERGERLADALAAHPAAFRPFYVSLVRAGERTGDLADAFARLTDLLERESRLRAKLLSALLYPLILAVAGGVAMLVILFVVLPGFAELLTGSGATMPASTALVLGVSAAVRRFWFLLPALAVLAAMLVAALRRRTDGRQFIARCVDRIPVAGALMRDAAAARFARTTGTLLAGGSPLLPSLDDAIEATAAPLAVAAGGRVRIAVREGMPLHRALEREPAFPPILAQLTALGEESGRLGEFLLKAAQLFEERSERTMQRLVALAEPALIVAFGGVIGFVALSLLQAIYGVNAGSFR